MTDYEKMLATISIEGTYSNSSFREEEVIYEFFVDGTAVMHDLKLGPNLEFEGIIAPSGAARRLYDQEVRRTRDPALLEQLGPKQYRLSVFPVPGKNDRTILNGKSQRVKITYTAALTPEGYPLPQYSQENNVKSVKDFSLVIDGEQVSTDKNEKFALISEIETATDKLCQADTQVQTRTNLGIGTGYLTTAADCSQPEEQDLFSTISDKKIAILQDVSYQNKNSRLKNQLLDYFKQHETLLSSNQFDLYYYNDLLSASKTLLNSNYQDLLDTVYFGSSDLNSIIEELELNYDLIFLLSSAEDYRITPTQHELLSPTYIIHTNEVLAYNSSLAAALWRVDGDVFNSWADAKQQAGVKLTAESSNQNRELLKNDRFFKLELDTSTAQYNNDLQAMMAQDTALEDEIDLKLETLLTTDAADPLSYLIAQGYIEQQYQKLDSGMIETEDLDMFQELSKQSGIISPYSSYIALDNERQVDDLDQISDDDNRYEDGSSSRPPTGGPFMIQPTTLFDAGSSKRVGFTDMMVPQAEMAAPMGGGGGLGMYSATNGGGSGISLGISSYITLFIGANILLVALGLIYLAGKKVVKNRLKKRKKTK